jgi:hypothetical protein
MAKESRVFVCQLFYGALVQKLHGFSSCPVLRLQTSLLWMFVLNYLVISYKNFKQKKRPTCSPCWSFVSLQWGLKFGSCAIAISGHCKTSRDASIKIQLSTQCKIECVWCQWCFFLLMHPKVKKNRCPIICCFGHKPCHSTSIHCQIHLSTANYIYSLTITSFQCQLHHSTGKYIFPLPITSFHCQMHLSTAKYIFPLRNTSFHCQLHHSTAKWRRHRIATIFILSLL